MNGQALNLLRHPRRRLHLASPLTRWCAIGLVPGWLAGAGCGLWAQAQLPELRAQLQQWQAQLAQQARADAEAAARDQQRQRQQQVQERLAQWQSRRAQLLQWHGALGEAADHSGLRLQRWQGEEQRIELQGWLPQASDWPLVQARLAQAGPQVWTLRSLQAGAGEGVQLVLEAPWRATPGTAAGAQP